METTFNKISIKGEGSDSKVVLGYHRQHEDHVAEFTDAPKDSFLASLRKFDGFVGEMVDTVVGEVKCHTVNITVVKSLRKVTLSATKKLGNGKAFNFNTPTYIEAKDAENVGDGNCPAKVIKSLGDLTAEAQKYLDGERSQREMFDENEQTEAEQESTGTQTDLTEVDSDTASELTEPTGDSDTVSNEETPPETSDDTY